MVAREIRLWGELHLGRCPPLPGCMFEQQGKEPAKAVLSVGSGTGEDPDDPELGSVSFGSPPPALSVFILHISVSSLRWQVSLHCAVTIGYTGPRPMRPARSWRAGRGRSMGCPRLRLLFVDGAYCSPIKSEKPDCAAPCPIWEYTHSFIVCRGVWGNGGCLGMVIEGDLHACPPHGACL